MSMRRLVLGLNAATVMLVVLGIALLVAPTPLPTRHVTSSMVALMPRQDTVRRTTVADLGAADRVVKTDIFSPRRGPPARRYAFGETSESDAAVAEVSVAPGLAGEPMDSAGVASVESDGVPHLYGTMMGPTESSALLRLDARIAEPRLYRVGDRAGGYRVSEVTDRTVTLVGSSGRVVLRLAKQQ